MIFPVNTSTVLLTCKILQIYFDKLKLTGHKCYDGLLNISEASPVHYDDREIFEALLFQVYTFSVLGWREREGTNVRLVGIEIPRRREGGMLHTDCRIITSAIQLE